MRYLDLADTLRDRIAGGSGALCRRRRARPGVRGQPGHGAPRARAAAGRRAGVGAAGRGLVRGRRPGPPVARAGDHHRGRGSRLAGAHPTRRVLEFRFETAPADVAKTLGSPADGEVLRVDAPEPRRRRAVRHRHRLGRRGARCAAEPGRRRALHVLRPAAAAGRRARARHADASPRSRPIARPRDQLGVPTGSPLLACRRVTYDRHGDAVIVAEHRYAAHLTALEVEFPAT